MADLPFGPTKLPLPAECCIPQLPVAKLAGVYNIVLGVEKLATENNDKTLLQSARIIGQLLISFGDLRWLFGDEPLIRLTQEIVSSRGVPRIGGMHPSDEVVAALTPAVHELAMFYRENFLRVFRTRKQRYTDSEDTESPNSPPYFDSLQALREECLKGSDEDRALARDGFRCVLTGRYAHDSAMQTRELRQLAGAGPRPMGLVPTQCCRIIPQWNAQKVKDLGSQHPAARVLAAFGISRDFDAEDELANLLTLRTELIETFAPLYLWLEPTPTANEYKLCGHAIILITYDHRPGDIIRFEDHSGSNPPVALPDPYLLALHGICARVAHASGVLEFFGRWEDEHHDLPFLLPDGSSADVLIKRLNYELMLAS